MNHKITSIRSTQFLRCLTKVGTAGIGHYYAVDIPLTSGNDILGVYCQGEVETDNVWEPEHGEVVVGTV